MRVRTEERREAILEIAAQVFMEMGYERASMAEIAARVGGSKATLYGYFPSKEELFMSMVLHKVGGQVAPAFEELPSLAEAEPRTVLTGLGERLLIAVLSPDAIALKRLIISHIADTKVAERCWALGPQQMVEALEAYLAAATKAGRLNVKDPKVAARHLCALYEAEPNWRGPFGSAQLLTRQQIKQAAARAVDVFLAAYGRNPETGKETGREDIENLL